MARKRGTKVATATKCHYAGKKWFIKRHTVKGHCSNKINKRNTSFANLSHPYKRQARRREGAINMTGIRNLGSKRAAVDKALRVILKGKTGVRRSSRHK